MIAGWENGTRVPTVEPDPFFDDEEDAPDRNAEHLAILRKFVYVQLQTSRSLYIECFALALSILYDGCSMSDIAKRYGVTRALVSKKCIFICETFGVPPSRAMRSVRNREACRRARLLSRSRS